jgi:hypothetical protein
MRSNCQRMARYQRYPTAAPHKARMTTFALENEPLHHIIHAVHSSVKTMAPAFSGIRGRLMVVLRVVKTPANIIAH